jgi:hypothetical protein
MNLSAGQGVAVREFKMADGHGFADCMLFVEVLPRRSGELAQPPRLRRHGRLIRAPAGGR